MKQTPILFLGDSPFAYGGLSRIGRDIALVAAKMDEFRVGFLGRGGMASRQFPWMQYNFPEDKQWGEEYLEAVWHDFSGGEPGIVMTIWDPSRLLWFSQPTEDWLKVVNFKRWGYFPVDHEGPKGKLSAVEAEAIAGYDRVLTYGIWGSAVVASTLGWKEPPDFIPHGINMDIFRPIYRTEVRKNFGIDEDTTVVGCVMTNQWRKDWGLAFEILDELSRKDNVRGWFKVDSLDRYWDLRALASDFSMGGRVIVDIRDLNDTEMAQFYSACDITMLPSLGEGFGYPIVESLACGVPVVHGNYGGGAELVPSSDFLVEPRAFRYDTRYNCRRPVYAAGDWCDTIHRALEQWVPTDASLCRSSVEHLDWSKLHTVWKRWFKEGLE